MPQKSKILLGSFAGQFCNRDITFCFQDLITFAVKYYFCSLGHTKFYLTIYCDESIECENKSYILQTLYKSLIKFKVVAKDIVCEYMLQIMCFFMVYDDPFTSKEQILTIGMKLFALYELIFINTFMCVN